MASKNRLDMGGIIVPKGSAPPGTATVPQRVTDSEPRSPTPAPTEVEERMVSLTVKVPASLYSKLRRFAVDRGRTHQDVGLAALRAYLDEHTA